MKSGDSKEFINAVVGWDIQNWRPILKHWKRSISDISQGKALELGCGPGGLSMWFAINGFEVWCSDIDLPNEKVKALHSQFNITDIHYLKVDALDIEFENQFDIVVFKSVIGGVARDGHDERRELVMKQIYKSLKPGGKLIFAENLKGSPLHSFFRKTFVKWGTSWNYASVDDMLAAMSVFNHVEYKVRGFAGAFGRTESQRRFLSLFDRFLFEWLVPSKWKYIMYGSATKSE